MILFALCTLGVLSWTPDASTYADKAPNMVDFELHFAGCDGNMPSATQINKKLETVLTGGVEVSHHGAANVEDIDINIEDVEKLDAIPVDLFAPCTFEIKELRKYYSEMTPGSMEGLEDLIEVIDENSGHFSSRRNLAPAVLDFSSCVGPARQQGSSSSCAAFSTSSVIEIAECREWGKPPSVYISPISIYAYKSGALGMSPSKVFAILRDYGASMEKHWPFVKSLERVADNMKPTDIPAKAKESAQRHKVLKTFVYRGRDPAKVKAGFVEYGAAMIATHIYGYGCDMWTKTGPSIGGHGMAAIGYNEQGVIIRNSWGPDWCNKGNDLLKWEDLGKIWGFWWWKDAKTEEHDPCPLGYDPSFGLKNYLGGCDGAKTRMRDGDSTMLKCAEACTNSNSCFAFDWSKHGGCFSNPSCAKQANDDKFSCKKSGAVPAQDLGKEYERRITGTCSDEGYAPVKDMKECGDAAKALGFAKTVARDDKQESVKYDPPYCYYENGRLKFNKSGKNTGKCKKADKCLCEKVEVPTYVKRTTGACSDRGYDPIKSLKECTKAGLKLGLISGDDEAKDDGQSYTTYAWDPPFCYYEFGQLKYNPKGNTGPCKEGDICLCIEGSNEFRGRNDMEVEDEVAELRRVNQQLLRTLEKLSEN